MARAAHVLMCKDLVTHALTGEIASDVSDMGGAGLLRLPDNGYDDALLDAYGLAEAKALLPKLYWPIDVVGRVTRGGCGENRACRRHACRRRLLRRAGERGRRRGDTAGAGFADPRHMEHQPGDRRRRRSAGVFMSAPLSPGRFMSMENSATSATNLEWLAHNLLAHDSRAREGPFALADALASRRRQNPTGRSTTPISTVPASDAAARAGWFGLAGWHDGADMLRALFEGVAFAHLAHLARLEASGVGADDITLSGGGAKSPVWPQMIADMLGRPVKVAAETETGALGAAMAAAVGTGRYRDLDEAAEAMVAAPRRRRARSRYEGFLSHAASHCGRPSRRALRRTGPR